MGTCRAGEEDREFHLYVNNVAVFLLKNVGCCPVCSSACCAAAQFRDVGDFLIIPTLVEAGLAHTRLNNTLGFPLGNMWVHG